MQTKPKSNSVITHRVEELPDGNVNIIYTVLDAGEVTLHTKRVSDANMQHAAIHGLIQRGSDGAALSRDPTTGKPASAMDKLAGIRTIVEHLESGDVPWKMTGTGEGGGKSLTIEAIAAVKSIPYKTAEDYVNRYAEKKFEGNTKKCLAFLRTSGPVQTAMSEIRAARQKAPVVDADKALSELG